MHRVVVLEDHGAVVTAPRALPARRVPRHRRRRRRRRYAARLLPLPLLPLEHSIHVRAKRIPPFSLASPRQRRTYRRRRRHRCRSGTRRCRRRDAFARFSVRLNVTTTTAIVITTTTTTVTTTTITTTTATTARCPD